MSAWSLFQGRCFDSNPSFSLIRYIYILMCLLKPAYFCLRVITRIPSPKKHPIQLSDHHPNHSQSITTIYIYRWNLIFVIATNGHESPPFSSSGQNTRNTPIMSFSQDLHSISLIHLDLVLRRWWPIWDQPVTSVTYTLWSSNISCWKWPFSSFYPLNIVICP